MLKKFSPALSSLMYFNFIKFQFLYLTLYIFKATYCVYYLNKLFVNDCDKCCKQVSPTAGFRHSCISISSSFSHFPLYIGKAIYCVYDSINYFCVTAASAIKSFACGGLSSLLYFDVIMFA